MSILKDLLESELLESKMSKLDADIRELFKTKKREVVKIGKSSIHTFKNNNETRKYVVYPVVFVKDDGKETSARSNPTREIKKQEYQDYVYHPIDSLDIKLGLPKKMGGDMVSTT